MGLSPWYCLRTSRVDKRDLEEQKMPSIPPDWALCILIYSRTFAHWNQEEFGTTSTRYSRSRSDLMFQRQSHRNSHRKSTIRAHRKESDMFLDPILFYLDSQTCLRSVQWKQSWICSVTSTKFGGNSLAIPKLRVSGENSQMRDLHIPRIPTYCLQTLNQETEIRWAHSTSAWSEKAKLLDAWEDWICRSHCKRWTPIVDYIFVQDNTVWKSTDSEGIHIFSVLVRALISTPKRVQKQNHAFKCEFVEFVLDTEIWDDTLEVNNEQQYNYILPSVKGS
jgi:hypothetical protein